MIPPRYPLILTLRTFVSGPLDGTNDTIMRAATAHHPFQRLLNLRFGWMGGLVEQSFGGHDHPVTAIPALRRLLRQKCFLKRVETIRTAYPFQGCDTVDSGLRKQGPGKIKLPLHP